MSDSLEPNTATALVSLLVWVEVVGLTLYDLHYKRVPNQVTLPLLLAGLILHFPGQVEIWLGCLLLFLSWRAHFLGAGDAKLWMALLWLKATGIIALLPIVAGGIFKAAVLSINVLLPGGGLLAGLIRLMWLLAAVGLMLSLAGILSKVTLSAAADAAGQLVGAVKAVVSTAALAMSGVGAGAAAGAGGASAAGGGAGSIAGVGGFVGGGGAGSAAGGVPGGEGEYSSALGHYQAAEDLTRRASWMDAAGLHAPAQYNRSQAHVYELQARQAELQDRMARFSGSQTGVQSPSNQEIAGDPQISNLARNLQLSSPVAGKMLTDYNGDPQTFEKGFDELNKLVQQMSGSDLRLVAPTHPAEVGRMVEAFQDDPNRFHTAQDPLTEAAFAVQARGVLCDLGENIPPDWDAVYPATM